MNLNEVKTNQDWVNFALANRGRTMSLVASAGDGVEYAMKNALSKLPYFQAEANAQAIIIYVGAEPNRFNDSELSLCMYLWEPNLQQGDWWTGSLSEDYMKGNDAGRTYLQSTIDQLKKIGYDAYAQGGFNNLPLMVGEEIPIWITSSVSKNGRTYYTIKAIGSSFEVRKSVPLSSLRLPPAAPSTPAWGQQPFQQPAQQQQQPQFAPQQPAQPQQQPFQQPQWQQPPQAQPQPQFAPPQQPANPFGGNPFGGTWNQGSGLA